MNFNFEVLEMQKWNIPANRDQRVDKKLVVRLVIMFIFRVMVVKMWKMAQKLVTVWEKHLSAPEKSSWDFSKNSMVNRPWI